MGVGAIDRVGSFEDNFTAVCDSCGTTRAISDSKALPANWARMRRDGVEYILCSKCADRALSEPEAEKWVE